MSLFARIWSVLLLVSLLGIQLAQVHHPEHAEPGTPCFQTDCGQTGCVSHGFDACKPCEMPDKCNQDSDHHHHDFGCCSHVSINALDAAVRITLFPPPATLALLASDDRIPGESPVYAMDKPPLIRA